MYGYVHPGGGWADVDRAPSIARGLLAEAVRGLPAWTIRHPHPCSLARLDAVISELATSVAGSLGAP